MKCKCRSRIGRKQGAERGAGQESGETTKISRGGGNEAAKNVKRGSDEVM